MRWYGLLPVSLRHNVTKRGAIPPFTVIAVSSDASTAKYPIIGPVNVQIAVKAGRVRATWRRAGLVSALCLVFLALVTPAYPQQTLTWDPNGAAAGTGQHEVRLVPAGAGSGMAMRACRLISCFALRVLAEAPWNVTEVVAQIDGFNVASLQMIERAGFVHADSCVAAGAVWELFAIDLLHLCLLYTSPSPRD